MKTNTLFPLQMNELEVIIKSKFENHSDEDLLFSVYEHKGKKVAVFGITYLIDTNKLESSLLTPLLSHEEAWTSRGIINEIPLGNVTTTNSLKEVFNKIILGEVFIYIEEEKEIVSYSLADEVKRSL
ncbi:spore germination protein, partial [Microvirga sp. 3-52]|nr:spore germination protein [Microvirga sp. 3-52]